MAVAIDTETHPFGGFNMAPKVVCLTYAESDTEKMGILVGDDIEAYMKNIFHNEFTIVGHNIAYDMACLAATFPSLTGMIWDAYDASRIECTRIRQQLIAIKGGDVRWEYTKDGVLRQQYSLAGLAERRLGKTLDKDEWRLKYKTFDNVPLDQWPKGAIDYAIDDAETTLEIWQDQEGELKWDDLHNQVRAAWALHLIGVWGIRADKKRTVEIHERITKEMVALTEDLKRYEIIRPNGKKNLKRVREMVTESFAPVTPPLTDKGAVKTNKDTLEICSHPALQALMEYNSLEKTKSTYLEVLLGGIHEPIHASFDVLGANSGRTSCRKPNLQNQPRMPGVRECFVPSQPHYVFAASDYDSQELRTLAQVCLEIVGTSALAERYQSDPDFDPHIHFAAQVMGLSYDEAMARYKAGDKEMDEARQRAKAANFGFPGGMGATAFRSYAKNYGVILTQAEAEKLRDDWFEQWPEMGKYFRFISSLVGRQSDGEVEQLTSKRIRGHCGYTDAANSYFQGLAADSSKLALYVVCRAAYNEPESPLYGWRPVNFVHDEIIMEGPEETAHEAAQELSSLMEKAMAHYTPDVPVRASATLMRYWSKKAKPTFKDGRLVPWEGN